ncbi:MAG: transposase [Deltaproteobacteria bacterium]|nr:transposase [Deltaproteobacteria bacterium]
MSVCACLYMDIPSEIRLWGEHHLELDNPYRIIGDLMFDFIEETELTCMYSNLGRPSINPMILSLVTIFQYLEDIPDRTAALLVKTRLDWKYALHLPLDDAGFHYSDLCNFRQRLLAHSKDSLIFDQLLKKISSLGFLHKRGYQRTDSTHVLAVVRHLSRLENLSEGLRVAYAVLYGRKPSAQAIEKADAVFYQHKLPSLYKEHWSKPAVLSVETETSRVSDYQMTDDERKKELERLGKDIHWLLDFLSTNRQSFLSLPEVEVLDTLFSQHFTIHNKKEVVIKQKATTGKEKIQSACDRTRSPHDPEARYSTKRDKSWTGYAEGLATHGTAKVHVTETANEKGKVNFVVAGL